MLYLHNPVRKYCLDYLLLHPTAFQIHRLNPTFSPRMNQCPIVGEFLYIVKIPLLNEYTFYRIYSSPYVNAKICFSSLQSLSPALTNVLVLKSTITR